MTEYIKISEIERITIKRGGKIISVFPQGDFFVNEEKKFPICYINFLLSSDKSTIYESKIHGKYDLTIIRG